jgi:short-subunit dehydrogenase
MHNKEVVIIGGGSGISTRLIQEYSKRYAVIVFSRKKRLI